MRSLHWLFPFLLGALALQSCGAAPQVVQGTVVSCSLESHTLVVRDERSPERKLTLSLAEADIGATPEAGDVVRVAYVEKDGRAVALRVMNLTKQKELQTKKG